MDTTPASTSASRPTNESVKLIYGPTLRSTTTTNNQSIESDRPCCASLAKSVYKKVLEGAKKAIPHSGDKNQDFPRSSADFVDFGKLNVQTIESEMDATTEGSLDYDDHDPLNSKQNDTSDRLDADQLRTLVQMDANCLESDDDYFEDESGSPSDIDLNAFERHVQATVRLEQQPELIQPKVISTYLKDSKRKRMLRDAQALESQTKQSRDDSDEKRAMATYQEDKTKKERKDADQVSQAKSADLQEKQGIFRVRDKRREQKRAALPIEADEAKDDGDRLVRDSIDSSDLGGDSIDLPTITITEDELADSSLNWSRSTLCGDTEVGSESEFPEDSKWIQKEGKSTEEDTETLRSAVNASERLKARLKNVSGKMKGLFGGKERSEANAEHEKVEELLRSLDGAVVYRPDEIKKEEMARKAQRLLKEKEEKRLKEEKKRQARENEDAKKAEKVMKKKKKTTAVPEDNAEVAKTKTIVKSDEATTEMETMKPLEVITCEVIAEENHEEETVLASTNLMIEDDRMPAKSAGETRQSEEELETKVRKMSNSGDRARAKQEAKALAKKLKQQEEADKRKRAEEEGKRVRERERMLRDEERRLRDEERKCKEEEQRLRQTEEKRLAEENRKRKEAEKAAKEWDEKRRKEAAKAKLKAEEQRKREEKERIEQWQKHAELAEKERRLREAEHELFVRAQQTKEKMAAEAAEQLAAERERIERHLRKKQEAESRRLADKLAKLEREVCRTSVRVSPGPGLSDAASVGSMSGRKTSLNDASDSAGNKTDGHVPIKSPADDAEQHPRLLSSVGNTDDELLLRIESASYDGSVAHDDHNDGDGTSAKTRAKRKVLLSRRLRDTRNRLNKLRTKAVGRLRDLLLDPEPDGRTTLMRTIRNKWTRSASLTSLKVHQGSGDGKSIDTSRPEISTTLIKSRIPPARPPPPTKQYTPTNASEPCLTNSIHYSSMESVPIELKDRKPSPRRPPPPSTILCQRDVPERSKGEHMDDIDLRDTDEPENRSVTTIQNRNVRTPANQYYRELIQEWRRKHYDVDDGDTRSMIASPAYSGRWITSVTEHNRSRSTPNVQRCASSVSVSRPPINDEYYYRNRLKRRAAARKASNASKAPTEPASWNDRSNDFVTGLPPIAPPRRRLTTAAYLSGSKRSLHRPITVDYFRPEVDRSQQAVDALFWKPFSWKCGRCRSLTELYVRKQHMSSEEQVRQFENSVPFKLTTQYCAPRRPAPPARSSSRLVSPCSLDHWNSDSYSVQLTSLLPAPESYTDNVCDTLHSPAIRSSSSSVDDLPPIPPPPVPPRGGRSSASAFSRYHEKPVQTSLEDISGDLSGSDDNDGPQSLTYRSAISRSNGHTRTAVPSHVYYDADLISDTYGEVDSLDTADLSLLSCLSQLPDSLNQTMTGSVDNRVGSVTVEPLLQVRPRRKRRLVPLPLHDDEHIIHVHRSQASNDATDLETKDDEDEDDTDEIIGIAASLQREIKLLLERRKEQMVQDSSDQEE